ncbi:MAG TPA: hypothetical protein PKC08_03735 [Pseudomonadales bacterium]|nr:hypothetical protein [Pseudomonadales bacterium]
MSTASGAGLPAGASALAGNTVLHVGMSKCGSSALQAVLSFNPELGRGASAAPVRYVVLQKNGALATGERITAYAQRVPSGYALSARASDMAKMGLARVALLRRELASARRDGARLILSNEGWAHEHEEFRTGRLLERLDLDCSVLIYVRPQVEWCNAAWWQWGAWTGLDLPAWIEIQRERIQWNRVVDAWRSVPGVREVQVRLLPPAIVTDFCEMLGVASPGNVIVNRSLPSAVLRLFQRQRSLRPGPHDSGIEFAIARHIELPNAGTPWVMPADMIEEVIDTCREGNRQLLEQLDPVQQEQMRANPAWWDAAHVAERPRLPWQVQPPSAQDAEDLAVRTLGALQRLDERCRTLEHELLCERSRPWWQRWLGLAARDATGQDGSDAPPLG